MQAGSERRKRGVSRQGGGTTSTPLLFMHIKRRTLRRTSGASTTGLGWRLEALKRWQWPRYRLLGLSRSRCRRGRRARPTHRMSPPVVFGSRCTHKVHAHVCGGTRRERGFSATASSARRARKAGLCAVQIEGLSALAHATANMCAKTDLTATPHRNGLAYVSVREMRDLLVSRQRRRPVSRAVQTRASRYFWTPRNFS